MATYEPLLPPPASSSLQSCSFKAATPSLLPPSSPSSSSPMLKSCLAKLAGLTSLAFPTKKRPRPSNQQQLLHGEHDLSQRKPLSLRHQRKNHSPKSRPVVSVPVIGASVPTSSLQQRSSKRRRVGISQQIVATTACAAFVQSQYCSTTVLTGHSISKPSKKRTPGGRRVRFAQTERTVVEYEKQFDYSQRHSVWYQPTDYKEFRKDAEMICQAFATQQLLPSATTPAKRTEDTVFPQPQPQDPDLLRGFELWVSQDRLKNRFLSVQCIVHTSKRRNCSLGYLASVARTCSAWAKEAAIVQGTRDYFEVYQPALVSFLPILDTPSDFPFLPSQAGSAGVPSTRRPSRSSTSGSVPTTPAVAPDSDATTPLPIIALQRDMSRPIAVPKSRK